MNTVLTHERIKQYAPILDELLIVAIEQSKGRIRRPRREILEFIDAMTDICTVLQCQLAGGPQITPDAIKAIRVKAWRTLSTECKIY
ncbi:hypothetical protein V8G57_13780 [Collimonas sp. H4R21]|uniref:Uncharacterized protein n=1 Tax=Collimonas rhizosphaerae TaxID=3126357 RepID=A0ABU9PWZ1_9BURK